MIKCEPHWIQQVEEFSWDNQYCICDAWRAIVIQMKTIIKKTYAWKQDE
jgi:hypothetical protein